jgi:hypothetical protein
MRLNEFLNMTDTIPPYKLNASQRWLTLFAIALALAAAGAWLALASPYLVMSRFFSALVESLGFLGFLSSGFASGAFALKLCSPAIVIDSEGVVDNASGVGVGRIPWQNIQEIKELDFAGYTYVGIAAVNNEAVLETVNPIQRALLRSRLKRGLPLIIIPSDILGISAAELMGELHLRHPGIQ